MRPSFPTHQCLQTNMSPFQIPTAYKAYPRNDPWEDFLSQLMDSWLIFRRNRVSAHHFSSRPDCNNTADVPSFTLRTALSTIPFVSDLCGVDVQWFQERSSQALQMTLSFLVGHKNFCKLLCFSGEVFVLHGYDWIRWVAKSCTTTAYRWLFRESQPSLRTLWSAVVKSPKFSARGTTPPLRLLQWDSVILVLWQISQFRSFGKWL